ncbi:hypothetical protein LguiA_024532 [Lonicera macranthoides]
MLLTREVQERWKLKWIGDFLGEPMSCDVCGDWISNKCIYSCSRCNFIMDIVCASLNERNILRMSAIFNTQVTNTRYSFWGSQFRANVMLAVKNMRVKESFITVGLALYFLSIRIVPHYQLLSIVAAISTLLSLHILFYLNSRILEIVVNTVLRTSRFSGDTGWWGYLPWMSGHSSVDDLIQLPLSDESVTLISYFLKDKSLQRKNDRETPSKLHHFSPFRHDQPLIPFHGEINEIESGSGGKVSPDASLQIKKDGATSSKLNHFSHDHPLLLFDGEIGSASRGKVSCSLYRRVDDETLCDACVKPVLTTTPFYRCEESTTQCNFFLHKCCAELPMEIKHSLISELPLIFLPKCPEFFGLFICNGCDYFCNGFIYNCGNGRYCLDVTCAFLPRIVKHVAHPYHVLFLIKISFFADNNSKRCNACSQLVDRTVFVYSCDTCGF